MIYHSEYKILNVFGWTVLSSSIVQVKYLFNERKSLTATQA